MAASSNRSWMSATSSVGSASRDQDDVMDIDCHSMDSKDQLNTSMNSKSRSQRTGSSGGGGDRYNHYRRDPPTKVKPWMRDKAVTGPATGNNRVSRFRARNSNNNTSLGAEGSVGTSTANNSCANSLCSASSFPDAPASSRYSSMPIVPREVTSASQVPVQVLSSRHLLLEEDDTATIHRFMEEASHSSRTAASDQAVRQHEEQHQQQATNNHQQQEPREDSSLSEEKKNDSTRQEAVDEKEGPSSSSGGDVRSSPEDDTSGTNNHDETATVDTEGESTAESTTPVIPLHASNENDQGAPAENEDNNDTPETSKDLDGVNDLVAESSQEAAIEENINNTPSDQAMSTSTPPDEKKVEEDDTDDDSSVDSNDEDDDNDVFYDVLPSVQPSSYNPMARASISNSTSSQMAAEPVSVAAYAALDKPTPLAAAQAAFLHDAIAEGASEDETSLYENDESDQEEMNASASIDDDDNNNNNVSVDSNNNMSLDNQGMDVSLQGESFISQEELPEDATGTNSQAVVDAVDGGETSSATELASVPKGTLDEMNRIRDEIVRLEQSNTELVEKLKLAEQNGRDHEANNSVSMAASKKQMEEFQAGMLLLENTNAEVLEKLQEAEQRGKYLETNNADTALVAKEQAEKVRKFEEDLKQQEEINSDLSEHLKVASQSLEVQEAKNADTVASSEAHAEMMNGLGEELKRLEETNADLQQKLKDAEEAATAQEARSAFAFAVNDDANDKIGKLNEEIQQLTETNVGLKKKIKVAEEREKLQASRDENVTLAYVGDMPVDVGRLRVQCQKYFSLLRVAQLKNHCVRDKSPVKLVVSYNPKQRQAIDIQSLLDKGAAIEAQDTSYMFKSLDTFNKGHFHTHKLLIPWKIASADGSSITRSEFFAQVWQQLGSLAVTVGENKTVIPLFQESQGTLIPMPNAVLEGKLQLTPTELDRTFAARIAPYYRAIGRLMVQCIAATANDNTEYSLKIAEHVMPPILRQKLFRGVDPKDESYPLEQLLDHAFSVLGTQNMTRDKAFEYFGIDVRSYPDVTEAIKRIRVEVHEMWINERSLALKALDEGLTLNGLADMSFCCGLVPLEAVNEIMFSL